MEHTKLLNEIIMKVTINVKLINSKFDQAYADKENEGVETEDNYRILWEDEFEVKGDVTDLKIKNNASYTLAGYHDNDEEFSYEIPDMTLVECHMADGTVNTFAFSKKLIGSTNRIQKGNNLVFEVNLKSIKALVNPMDGVYILTTDYPTPLLKYIKEDEEE